MARNLIDLLNEDEEYDFEEDIEQKHFRFPKEDRNEHYRRKKQITQERKKRRKQKEDILTIKDDTNGDYR